jgi:hypothetical protein
MAKTISSQAAWKQAEGSTTRLYRLNSCCLFINVLNLLHINETKQEKPMKTQERPTTKQCSKCNEVKVLNEYPKKGAVCIICSRKLFKIYRDNNKELVNGRISAYRKSEEGKAKKVSADKEWGRLNPEKKKANAIKWRADNREQMLAKMNEYYRKNIDRFKQYNIDNKEARSIFNSAYFAERYTNDADFSAAVKARASKRRCDEMERTPKWACLKTMAGIYKEASVKTAETGIPHEVDHIFPIKGKKVSGLHCEANLQIITRAENRTKGNRV